MLAEASLLVALTVQHGSGTEACLDAPRLERGVEKRLKRRVFVEPARADLRFVVTFEKRADEIQVRIELSSVDGTPRGTRTLVTSGHCSTLDDSLALSVALLADQPPDPEPPPEPPASSPQLPLPPGTPTSTSTSPPPPPPPPASPPRRVVKSPPTPITLPPDVAAPREPFHLRAGAAAEAAWGVLPGIRPAAALYLQLLPRNFYPLTLQVEGFGAADAERDATSGVTFHLYRVGLAACPVLAQARRGSVGACIGQKLGFIEANGFGFNHDRNERRLSYAVALGGEARLRLFAPVSARGYLGAEVPVVRDRFASAGRNASTLFQPSPVALAAEIGLEAQLW